ncbi:hypothetical protein Btru_051526 [Bulinus truncatus]|nr:hypothetical protein Btru_051526 [Bulinus truncatus]
MKEREKNNQKTIECLQEKVCAYHEQLQQKEAALIMCRNEVKTHMACMEEIKSDFNNELQQRDVLTKQMKEDLRRVYEDLKCRSDESCVLERTIVDFKSRLHQCCCQLKEADSRVTCLQEKWSKTSTDPSQDLGHYCLLGQYRLSSCFWATVATREKDEEIQAISCDRNTLARELQNAKQEIGILQERICNLENDNKEICRLLQQKVKCKTRIHCGVECDWGTHGLGQHEAERLRHLTPVSHAKAWVPCMGTQQSAAMPLLHLSKLHILSLRRIISES